MWFFRELFRLIWMIAVTVAIATAVGALVALLSSGSFAHSTKVCFLAFGGLLLLLAGAGNRGTGTGQAANWGVTFGVRSAFGVLSPPIRSRSGDPTLTASAVFVGSGLVLIVLGLLI